MIDEKRIKEAENNIPVYLNESMLSKVKVTRKEILDTYKRNYKESFNASEKLFSQDISSLWVVVTSYYSMFYATNAVLYSLGYKVESKVPHKVTSDALIVYIRNKLRNALLQDFEDARQDALEIIGKRADEIISSFDEERNKRSIFQYETTEEIKKSKAKTSLERARKFIFEMEKLL